MTEGPIMSDAAARSHRMQALVWALLCEALCLVAGGIAFVLTGHVVWIVIGIVAGIGFSGPGVIRFVRSAKGQDRASR